MMASRGGISSSKGKQPSNHGSGSEEDGSVDTKSAHRGSDAGGVRRGERRRAMSVVGAEAVANGLTQKEFLEQAALLMLICHITYSHTPDVYSK